MLMFTDQDPQHDQDPRNGTFGVPHGSENSLGWGGQVIQLEDDSSVSEEFHDAMDPEQMKSSVPLGAADEESAPQKGKDKKRKKKRRCPGLPSKKGPIRKCWALWRRRNPRMNAFIFGLIVPLMILICLAMICGYPLALMESPSELDQNDFVLEQQMRLLIEGSLYANVTQNLPRICLSLYFTNSTVDEFLRNLTIILAGPLAIDKYFAVLTQEDIYNLGDVQEVVQEVDIQEVNETFREVNETYQEGNFTFNASNSNNTRHEAFQEVREVDLVVPLLDMTMGLNPGISDVAESYDKDDLNLTEMALFVDECGTELSPIIDKMIVTMIKTANLIFEGLVFAWSKCPENETTWLQNRLQDEEQNLYDGPNYVPTSWIWNILLHQEVPENWDGTWSYFSQDAQSAFYRQRWEQDRRRLYREALQSPVAHVMNATSNSTSFSLSTRLWAFEQSITHATGREGCVPHVPAACWFWFTVMTTIGYGNSSPATQAGRIMVYTLGFLTILLFGGVSARSGYIITALLEDFLTRIGAHILNRPYLITIIWGAIYYGWMVVIAGFFIWWQEDRLGDDGESGLKTGYWFAYISTTTVGFGDLYLKPEVITAQDLASYPILFLLGFSFLAAFLAKLSDIIIRPFRNGESLVRQFKKADDEREDEKSKNN